MEDRYVFDIGAGTTKMLAKKVDICQHHHIEKIDINDLSSFISIDKRAVKRNDLKGIDDYYQKFISLI